MQLKLYAAPINNLVYLRMYDIDSMTCLETISHQRKKATMSFLTSWPFFYTRTPLELHAGNRGVSQGQPLIKRFINS